MKTSIKILFLLLFSIGAIGGILIFAKTRVAPPIEIDSIDPYSTNLQSEVDRLDDVVKEDSFVKDFARSQKEYIRLDDKIKRFYHEHAIDSETSDRYRKKIDATYGDCLTSYGFDLLQKSVWPKEDIDGLSRMLATLNADRLTTGEKVATVEFIASANKLNSIINDYRSALRLSRNVSFRGMENAKSKIVKAAFYRSSDYLKNNIELVDALDALAGRIAQSHYNYIRSRISSLGNFKKFESSYYNDILVPSIDKAIVEYKETTIYGNDKKPDISALESKAIYWIQLANNYYVSKATNGLWK